MLGKSFINNIKHKGFKTLPSRTPFNCLMSLEKAFLTFKCIIMSIRSDFNQSKYRPDIPHAVNF